MKCAIWQLGLSTRKSMNIMALISRNGEPRIFFLNRCNLTCYYLKRASKVMQRRPEINVSVGRVLQNIHSYSDHLCLPSRSSMTTKYFIHMSGVYFRTFIHL
jgi:hypothetical protein